MSRDEIIALALIGSLSVWGAIHALVAFRISSRMARWRGFVAFVVPPMAPYWAVRAGHLAWAVAWWGSLGVWAIVRVFLSG